jgi:DNA-binding NarL/FixJ family response regulator
MQEAMESIFKSLPDLQVVGTASGGLSAVHLLQRYQPDLIVIDASIPDGEALALVRQVKAQHATTSCIVLTTTTRQMHGALAEGADVVLPRSVPYSTLVMAVRNAGQARPDANQPVPGTQDKP